MTQYILYVRPTGPLAQDLSAFWESCNAHERLHNEAVTVYPPHVTLTSLFKKILKKSEYIAFLEAALKEVPAQKDARITPLTFKSTRPDLHAMYFQNEFLRQIAELFGQKIGLPKDRLKATVEKPEYHLTLGNNFNSEVGGELRQLEAKIDFTKEYGVSLCLYKSKEEDGKRKLTLQHEIKL
jgi:hypothetical protein